MSDIFHLHQNVSNVGKILEKNDKNVDILSRKKSSEGRQVLADISGEK